MIYGYRRVSTKSQAKDGNSLEAQEAALKAVGAQKIYSDAFTGTKSHRPELDKLLEVIQPGDTLIVTKLDRIARSASQGTGLIEALLKKDIIVHILNIGIMDSTPTGKLIRNILFSLYFNLYDNCSRNVSNNGLCYCRWHGDRESTSHYTRAARSNSDSNKLYCIL